MTIQSSADNIMVISPPTAALMSIKGSEEDALADHHHISNVSDMMDATSSSLMKEGVVGKDHNSFLPHHHQVEVEGMRMDIDHHHNHHSGVEVNQLVQAMLQKQGGRFSSPGSVASDSSSSNTTLVSEGHVLATPSSSARQHERSTTMDTSFSNDENDDDDDDVDAIPQLTSSSEDVEMSAAARHLFGERESHVVQVMTVGSGGSENVTQTTVTTTHLPSLSVTLSHLSGSSSNDDDGIDASKSVSTSSRTDASNVDLKVVCPYEIKRHHDHPEDQIAVPPQPIGNTIANDSPSSTTTTIPLHEPVASEATLDLNTLEEAITATPAEDSTTPTDPANLTYKGMSYEDLFPTHPLLHKPPSRYLARRFSWLRGRPLTYYPGELDPRLPWHFSWVDDGMIGGMSAPIERCHWRAMADAGIGLVVNLTECAISPGPSGVDPSVRRCDECLLLDEPADCDLFNDLDDPSGPKPSHPPVDILFLPVRDGSIPSFHQLHTFVLHARETIAKGLRVVAHCQAGVGRTGTFLAVFLMLKYACTPSEALIRLRAARPQSLQFHRTLWQTHPFHLYDDEPAGLRPDDDSSDSGSSSGASSATGGPGGLVIPYSPIYNRNLLQERFLERYHHLFIAPALAAGMKGELPVPMDLIDPELFIGRGAFPPSRPHTTLGLNTFTCNLIDRQLEVKMGEVNMPIPTSSTPTQLTSGVRLLIDSYNSEELVSEQNGEGVEQQWKCFVCRGIQVVGPMPAIPNKQWPY